MVLTLWTRRDGEPEVVPPLCGDSFPNLRPAAPPRALGPAREDKPVLRAAVLLTA